VKNAEIENAEEALVGRPAESARMGHRWQTDSVAGVRGLELGNVGFLKSRPNSLLFRNILAPETFRGRSREGKVREAAFGNPHTGARRARCSSNVDHPASGCPKLSAGEAPDPGRHHVGTPGDIVSECPGDFVGIRKPASRPPSVRICEPSHR
jgi:hypothetical protein